MKYGFKNRYHLEEMASPTYYNLAYHLQRKGWLKTNLPLCARLCARQFEFDSDVAQCLEYKHELATLIQAYCPHIHPETYLINDANWIHTLNQIAEKHYTNGYLVTDKIDNITWILKPSLLNNGQHIKLFQSLSDIEHHYLSSNRLGGAHVLQRYIAPHLLNGKKYSIRLFVVMTNYAGIYLYREGYYNEALHVYNPQQIDDLQSHLTNEHLHEKEPNVIQRPTKNWDLFNTLYPTLKNIVMSVADALTQKYPQSFINASHKALALFGFDFMVDDTHRVWLLEANHGPCFPIERDHPLQTILYDEFWQALIKSFILPMKKSNPEKYVHSNDFEYVIPK